MLKILGFLLEMFFIFIFPFVVLIRTAVYLHIEEKLFPWACIGGGILFTSILIFLYLTIFYGKLRKNSNPKFKTKALIAFAIVMIYSAHGIFYISSDNLKSKELSQEIRKVHPILRLSVSTIAHLDKKLIITDGDRQPEDYAKMGLPSKKHSLHYKQSNGYAHAIDLRTNGRNEVRNFFVRSYFSLMGFQTLRHVGNADHLHISLKSHDYPYSK